MIPFSWHHWLCSLIGPAKTGRKPTNKSACLVIAELLEDRLVPTALPVHDIYVVGVSGVTSSLHAGKPVFTDKTRFDDGTTPASSVMEIGATNTWVAPSLRAAVLFANANPGTSNQPDQILLETTGHTAATTYAVIDGEIDFDFPSGALVVRNMGTGISTIDAETENRLFSDYGGGVVTLNHLKLTGGSAYGGNATGGAIDNFGTMNLTNDQFVNNAVVGAGGVDQGGGAIYNEGTLNLNSDLFTGNQATDGNNARSPILGGALYNDSGAALSIVNSVFANNRAQGAADFQDNIGTDAGGGAIYLNGEGSNTVSITGTTFTNNNAIAGSFSGGESAVTTGGTARGGAIDCGINIASSITLNLTGCTFNGNSATAGDAHNSYGGSSYGGGNAIGGDAYGGALFADINANIVNSTFANNKANGGLGEADNNSGIGYGGNAFGGAIAGDFTTNTNSVNLVNDTIALNTAQAGRAVSIPGTNGPLSHKPAENILSGSAYGGGIIAFELLRTNRDSAVRHAVKASAGMNVVNTIIAENVAASGGPDVAGNFNSLGHNLIGRVDSDSTGFANGNNGDQVGTVAHPINPGLDPKGLQNNGGPTLTIGLVAGSKAINAGDNTFGGYTPAPTTDQRGFPRIVGPAVDIGAFEAPAFGKRGRDSLGVFFVGGNITVSTGSPG
jgi:hypothetical protein